jgi:uncharacterized membrane protein
MNAAQRLTYNAGMNKTPLPLEDLKKLGKPIRNPNIEHRQHLSRLERLAVWITGHVGTMGFFLIIFGWTILWLSWNMFAPKALRFDPFPAFVLWLFISNMIAHPRLGRRPRRSVSDRGGAALHRLARVPLGQVNPGR